MLPSSPLFEKFLEEEYCWSSAPPVKGHWNISYDLKTYGIEVPADRLGYSIFANVYIVDVSFLAGEVPYSALLMAEDTSMAYTRNPVASVPMDSTLALEDLPKFLGVDFYKSGGYGVYGLILAFNKFIQWRLTNGI
jgi:hypothetical protein